MKISVRKNIEKLKTSKIIISKRKSQILNSDCCQIRIWFKVDFIKNNTHKQINRHWFTNKESLFISHEDSKIFKKLFSANILRMSGKQAQEVVLVEGEGETHTGSGSNWRRGPKHRHNITSSVKVRVRAKFPHSASLHLL